MSESFIDLVYITIALAAMVGAGIAGVQWLLRRAWKKSLRPPDRLVTMGDIDKFLREWRIVNGVRAVAFENDTPYVLRVEVLGSRKKAQDLKKHMDGRLPVAIAVRYFYRDGCFNRGNSMVLLED